MPSFNHFCIANKCQLAIPVTDGRQNNYDYVSVNNILMLILDLVTVLIRQSCNEEL